MNKAELEKWEKEIKERDQASKKWEKDLEERESVIEERQKSFENWERDLKRASQEMDERATAMERGDETRSSRGKPSTMECPTCRQPADLSSSRDKTITSICGQGHKHVHGPSLMKLLQDKEDAQVKKAHKAFACPTCNKVATVINDPDADDGSAITECDAGHRHTLSNARRKELGIGVG